MYNEGLLSQPGTKKLMSIKEIRNRLINKNVYKGTIDEWMLKYNYDLRDEAFLRDILKNIKSNLAKKQKFLLKFLIRKKDLLHESISVLAKH